MFVLLGAGFMILVPTLLQRYQGLDQLGDRNGLRPCLSQHLGEVLEGGRPMHTIEQESSIRMLNQRTSSKCATQLLRWLSSTLRDPAVCQNFHKLRPKSQACFNMQFAIDSDWFCISPTRSSIIFLFEVVTLAESLNVYCTFQAS